METLIARAIKLRLPICILFLLIIGVGISSALTLPIDAFPDLVNNQVQVLSEAPGMGPEEAEQLVTIPIESVMNGLPNISQIRSISKYGLSVVTIVFNDKVNTYFARQLVLERLQLAKSRLPGDVNPELGPVSTAMGEIYQYVLSGPDFNSTQLKTINDWEVKYRLRTVSGVAEVNTWGGHTLQYVVTVLPDKLVQYRLTLNDVFEALKTNNNNFGAGVVNLGPEQYVLRGQARLSNLTDIENTFVKNINGAPIAIKNVAQVELGSALRQGAVTKDGQGEIVTGIVMMLKGENSRDVINRVKTEMEIIQKSLPKGLSLKPFYDQTNLVEQTIETVKTNLLEGGILVLVVLMVMLRNIRAALLVALVIPLSLLFSFMGMQWLGLSANIMSLGAIDFGMIVDGSIVMVENIVRKLAERENTDISNFEIIQDAVREMARPILFGVLIITIVYLPILSLQGMEYKMFSPMVFTVCFALLGSLITALTLVPVLATFLFRGVVYDKESLIVKAVKPPYVWLLEWALAHRTTVLTFAILGFLSTLVSVPFLGTEFVPQLDEGDIVVQARMPMSISLPEAVRICSLIENCIKRSPEVTAVESRIGRPDLATDPMGVYQADIFVLLEPKGKWRTGLDKINLITEMRQHLISDIPGTNFNFTQPIGMRVDELVSGVKAQLAVKLFGDDIEILQNKAEEIESILRKVAGHTDLQSERLFGTKQIVIIPDRLKMLRYGVNIESVRSVLETAAIGTTVSEIIQGRKRFDLAVKFPENSKVKPEVISSLLVESSSGEKIPLSQFAEIRLQPGLEVINRESGQRRVIVQCNVSGIDLGTFVKNSQSAIEKHLQLGPGYTIAWGGQFENQERAMQRLTIVVPISVVIIFFLLWATFGSVKSASLVLLNIPFALIGGVVSLWLRGMYLSVPASIGFIALFGVAVLNGVVLISYANELLRTGMSVEQAIKNASITRLRPVLMTALVATLGFLPMAISHGSGAEVQKPLATVVIGGLVTSTLLTLLVLPVLFTLFYRDSKET